MSVLIPVTLAENLINVADVGWGDFGLTVRNISFAGFLGPIAKE